MARPTKVKVSSRLPRTGASGGQRTKPGAGRFCGGGPPWLASGLTLTGDQQSFVEAWGRWMNVVRLANSHRCVNACRIITAHETESRTRGCGNHAKGLGAEAKTRIPRINFLQNADPYF
jgi:hypothetical protein